MLTIKLYERTGALIKTLPAILPVTISAGDGRDIRRTAKFTLEKTYLDDVKRLGRRVKIFDDDSNQLFAGYIDDVDIAYGSDCWLDISCRDNAKVYERSGFTADVTYEDASYTDTALTVTSASASTEMAAGDAQQAQGQTYGRKLQSTISGAVAEVTPTTETGSILTGDYSIGYTAAGLSLLRLTQYIDLLADVAIQAVTVTTNGTLVSTKISSDGVTFATFASGATGRYLEIGIAKAAGPITAGVVVSANVTYPASNAIDDDLDYWQPSPTDLDRELILNFASALTNGLRIKAGISDVDLQTAYLVDVYYDNAGAWTVAKANAVLTCGFNEVIFPAVTTTKLKVIFKQKNAAVAVRYAAPVYCDSTATIDQIIETILGTEGETDFTRITTTRQAPAGHAITYLAGQKKLKACIDLADSIGWEFFYDTDERPVLRPNRWASPLAALTTITAHLSWSTQLTDANLYNVILAKYEAGDAAFFAVAINSGGASATSTVNIGTRTSEVLNTSLANTQSKLDAWAQQKLAEMSRQTTTATCKIGALNSAGNIISIEPRQLLNITDPVTGAVGFYQVAKCDLSETETTLDWSLEVTAL